MKLAKFNVLFSVVKYFFGAAELLLNFSPSSTQKKTGSDSATLTNSRAKSPFLTARHGFRSNWVLWGEVTTVSMLTSGIGQPFLLVPGVGLVAPAPGPALLVDQPLKFGQGVVARAGEQRRHAPPTLAQRLGPQGGGILRGVGGQVEGGGTLTSQRQAHLQKNARQLRPVVIVLELAPLPLKEKTT